MRNTFLKSFNEVLKQFKEANKDPFKNKLKWLHLQEKLLKRLTRIESTIRKRRAEIKLLKAQLGNPADWLEKSVAQQIKNKLKKRKEQIYEQEKLYSLYKSIGDGIAFTFINRFDLKPQFFKQSPGFISGKKGTGLERNCLRAAFRHDIIAIMNDLTHVMKYADITLVLGKNMWRLVEVKSGRRNNARGERQNEMSNKLLEYVLKDTPADLYNLGAPMVRVSQVQKWKTNEKIMQKIFSEAKEKGFCLHKMRTGYYVAAEYGNNISYFDEFLNRMQLKKPMMLFQNDEEFKYQAMGLTPYCITFLNPEHYIDFLSGKLRIIHFVAIDKLAAFFKRRGYRLVVLDDPNYIFEFQQVADEAIRCRMSRHYFLRIFLEFVDMESVLSDTLTSFYQEFPDTAAFAHRLSGFKDINTNAS